MTDRAAYLPTPREYFAAHAPVEVPFWFEPVMAMPKPARPDIPAHWSEEARGQASYWLVIGYSRGSHIDDIESGGVFAAVVEEARAFEQEVRDADNALNLWERLYEIERRMQWPWTWADGVLGRSEQVKS